MSVDNRLWGAPHIHGELLKLGFAVAQSTVAKYMAKRGEPSGQSWGTFLHNHAPHIAAMDLFVVPPIGFIQLYVLVIVRLARRELVSFNVTAHPTSEWIAQQITEAFPWNEAPCYLVRDRDGIYGAAVTRRLRAMGIRDKPIAPSSPWQNAYAERLIGTIRRECLDHMIVFGETHLRRILGRYAAYYNGSRIHRSLDKDSPFHRAIEHLGIIPLAKGARRTAPMSRLAASVYVPSVRLSPHSAPIRQTFRRGQAAGEVSTGDDDPPARCPPASSCRVAVSPAGSFPSD